MWGLIFSVKSGSVSGFSKGGGSGYFVTRIECPG